MQRYLDQYRHFLYLFELDFPKTVDISSLMISLLDSENDGLRAYTLCVVAVQKTWRRTDSGGCGENKNTSTKLSST